MARCHQLKHRALACAARAAGLALIQFMLQVTVGFQAAKSAPANLR